VLALPRRSEHDSLVMVGDHGASAPSGWYADSDPSQLRWWDGKEWTNVVRPVNAPTDPRGGRLLRVSITLMTLGAVANVVVYPWIAGERTATGQVELNPTWVNVVSDIGLGAFALGLGCFIARGIMRHVPVHAVEQT
jgi:hypothetical protein